MFRQRRISLAALVAVCWVSGPALRAQSAPKGLAGRIERLIEQLPQSTQVGISVLNLDDGSLWFSHQPNRPLKPASVMKLFVMAAAIEHLGPDFAFTTEVYLHDDELWIRGGGDPGGTLHQRKAYTEPAWPKSAVRARRLFRRLARFALAPNRRLIRV